MTGCSSSATYIRATVPDHPLDRVAQQAQKNWSVERVDVNSLELSDAWPTYSFGALGYGASHANLFYDPAGSELHVQYYFKAFPIMTLWIPFSIDAEPGAFGAALKPTMNNQIKDILKWSDGTITSRRAGERSESFPPPLQPKPATKLADQ
ncbi:MAG TPA: hypothetical protein VM842_02575 [Nitrospira sp.]|nr:hypothetical protein [Nitrospira sp.]